MALVTQIEREVAVFVEREPSSRWIFAPYRDVMPISDTVTLYVPTTVREVGELNDLTTYTAADATVREVAQLNDAISEAAGIVSTSVRDLMEVNDLSSYKVVASADVTEVAELNDNVDATTVVRLLEVAELNDIVTAGSTTSTAVRETAQLSDTLTYFSYADVRETAELNDAAPFRTIARLFEREVAELNDTAVLVSTGGFRVRETALLSDTATVSTVYAIAVREVFLIEDYARLPVIDNAFPGVGDDFSGSPTPGSGSTFGPLTFGPGVFTCPTGGEWPMSIVNGGSMNAQTGSMNMGSAELKRMSAAYARTNAQTVNIGIRSDVGSVPTEYQYVATKKGSSESRTYCKALLGRGLRSSNVELQIATAAGSEVESIGLETATTTRRY